MRCWCLWVPSLCASALCSGQMTLHYSSLLFCYEAAWRQMWENSPPCRLPSLCSYSTLPGEIPGVYIVHVPESYFPCMYISLRAVGSLHTPLRNEWKWQALISPPASSSSLDWNVTVPVCVCVCISKKKVLWGRKTHIICSSGLMHIQLPQFHVSCVRLVAPTFLDWIFFCNGK